MHRFLFVAAIIVMAATSVSAQITANSDTLTARCCTTSLELVRDDSKAEARSAHKAYMKKHRRAERWIRMTISSQPK